MSAPRVLFVDDYPDDVDLALAVLQREQFAVDSRLALSVAEAMEAYGEGGWDAVVSDYNLGQGSGIELLQLIRERDPELPFILLSGTIGEERAVEAMRAGANDYVMKDRIGRLGSALQREIAAASARAAQKSLEARLRKAEERYRSTFEQAPLGIGNAGRDGRFFSVNQRFCELLGYAPEEMIGRHFTEFIHPEDVALCNDRFTALIAGTVSSVRRHVRRYVRKDGTVVWATVSLSLVSNAEGEVDYVIGCVEDLSQQKAAQETMLVQEQLLESVQQAVIATDAAGETIYWNAFAGTLYGWSAGEARGKHVLDLLCAEESRAAADAMMDGIRRGEGWAGEMLACRRDGVAFPSYLAVSPIFDERGTVIGAVGVSHDLTDRKRAEDELREHKLQLTDAQEIARMGSWTYDFRSGERRWSDGLYTLYGLPPGAIDIDAIFERVHPDDREPLRDFRLRALAYFEPFASEFRLATDRGERTLSIRCRIERNEAGTPIRLSGVVQDVTEIKQIEEELRRRTAQQTAVANLGQVALSGAPIDSVFNQAAFLLLTLLGADLSEIFRKQDEEFVLVAGEGWEEGEMGLRKRGGGSQAAYTIETNAPVVVTDTATETRFLPAEPLLRKGVMSGLTVVINSGDGTPWGVLGVHSRSRRTFAAYDVEFLRSMASVLGQAIDRAAADATLRTRARQQSAIASLGRLVLNSVDAGVLERATDLLIEGAGADDGFISELTDHGSLRLLAGRLWTELPREIPVSANAQAGFTILSGEPVVVADYRTETRFATYDLTVPYGILSGVMVPVASARRTFGVISAQSKQAGHFGAADVVFLQSLANVLAEALERQEARLAVEESERRYRRIFDGATEIIYTVDASGSFVTLNPAFETVTDWKCEEWLGRPFHEIIAPEDRERVSATFAGLLATGQPVVEEVTVLGRDRAVILHLQSFPKVENGVVTEAYGFARDITEARIAAEERERVMRSLQLLLESTVEGIYTIDLDGHCTMVNRAAAAFLDMAPDDLIGRRVHDLLHATRPDGTPLDIDDCPITTVLRTGQSMNVGSDVFSRRDGSHFPVAYSAAPIIDDGRLVGAVVTFTDLTERRKLEAKLEQADRLSSLGRLAATVAHEFNNVLMGIAPFLDVIRRTQSPEKVAKALDHIAGSVKRGRRVTQDILRFTQPGEPVLAAIDVREWLQSVMLEAKPMIGPKYTVTVDAPPLVIDGDAGQLHQIFMNLILNARDAMPYGGSIDIQARRERSDARFDFGAVDNPARFAHLTVTDTGTGMSEETLRYAFEPLFTTKNNGTGLGLAVTHQVVRRHGGEIFIESTPGEGTSFHIFIPLAASDAAPEDIAEAGGEWPRAVAARHVLLVEDDPAVAAGLIALLETEGFEVTVVDSGSRALEIVSTEAPDAVVLDIGLPDCDGRTVYTSIAALHPSLPVVFSTGHTDRSGVEAFLSRPNVGYLFKPYDSEALMEELSRAMAG